MKKQLIIAALLLALAVLAFMLLYTVTVYPAFQKVRRLSIDTLRQALRSDAIPLSRRGRSFAGAELYTFSGWTNGFAKPVGYVIDGTEPMRTRRSTTSSPAVQRRTPVKLLWKRSHTGMYPSGAGITAI